MPTAVLSYDHSWDIDGLVVGKDGIWKHIETQGLGLPDFRVSDEYRPQTHGLFFLGPDYMGGRVVAMSIGADIDYGVPHQALLDDLKYRMRPRVDDMLLRWRYDNVSTRRLKVRPRRCEFNLDELTYHGLVVAHLEFMAADPLIYDDFETVKVSNPVLTTGGLDIHNHSFPHGFGTTTSTLNTITNIGNAPTAPYGQIMAIGNGVSRVILENLTTGESWSMTLTMGGGDYIDFDFSDRTVYLGGTASRSINVDRPGSTWWLLAPGDNLIAFRAEPISGGTAQATIRSRSAWF